MTSTAERRVSARLRAALRHGGMGAVRGERGGWCAEGARTDETTESRARHCHARGHARSAGDELHRPARGGESSWSGALRSRHCRHPVLQPAGAGRALDFRWRLPGRRVRSADGGASQRADSSAFRRPAGGNQHGRSLPGGCRALSDAPGSRHRPSAGASAWLRGSLGRRLQSAGVGDESRCRRCAGAAAGATEGCSKRARAAPRSRGDRASCSARSLGRRTAAHRSAAGRPPGRFAAGRHATTRTGRTGRARPARSTRRAATGLRAAQAASPGAGCRADIVTSEGFRYGPARPQPVDNAWRKALGAPTPVGYNADRCSMRQRSFGPARPKLDHATTWMRGDLQDAGCLGRVDATAVRQ